MSLYLWLSEERNTTLNERMEREVVEEMSRWRTGGGTSSGVAGAVVVVVVVVFAAVRMAVMVGF